MPEMRTPVIDATFHSAFWEITETEEALRKGLILGTHAAARYGARKKETHRKGYLAVRQLLKRSGVGPQLHQYRENGAPFLTDGRYLSVSHAHAFAAIAVSKRPIGIDIENYREKILCIAPRFLHPKENRIDLNAKAIPLLTQIWTAKEAIYKALQISGLNFSKHIQINPFEPNEKKGTATIQLKNGAKKMNLWFLHFENYCATVAE